MKNLSFSVIWSVIFLCLLGLLPINSSFSADKKTVLFQLPLSGPLSSVGEALRAGIELAARDRPDSANLRFVFDDSQYSGKTAISSLQAFRARGEADMLFIFGGPPSLAVRSLVEDSHIPTLALSAATQLDSGGNGYVKRIWESATTMGSLIAEEIKKNNYKSVAVVSAENDANLAIADNIQKNLPFKFAFQDTVPLEENDFRAITTRLRSSKADVIVSNLLAGQHSVFISRLREQGIKLPIMVQSSIFFDSKCRPPYPPILEDLTVVTVDSKMAAGLYERLDPSTRRQNSVHMTAIGYDTTNFILNAVAAGWNFDSPMPVNNLQGSLGTYHRINDVAIEPPTASFRFKDGQLVPVS